MDALGKTRRDHPPAARADGETSAAPEAEAIDAVLAAFASLQSRNNHIVALVASSLGIGVVDVRALLFIARDVEVTPKRLAEFLELSTGAITSLVDRMVAAGLVQRVPHPNDRRSLLLEPADAGTGAIDRITDFYRRAFRDATDPQDLAFAAELLSAIADSLARTAESDIAAAEGR